MTIETEDLRVAAQRTLPSPVEVKSRYPASDELLRRVVDARRQVKAILERRDHRLLVVVGPCSIHDPGAALDYAERLSRLSEETKATLCIVMRAYFEKPRTTLGWKGLINDPYLDDTYHVEDGICLARRLLLDIAAQGLPIATEALDPMTPQYLQDLITWSAIGARTAESQPHREMASGLSSVVGLKNATDGSLGGAVNALKAVSKAHRFLGIDAHGRIAVIETRGNPSAHIVLRGGDGGPNYDARAIEHCETRLLGANLPANIMVDCSHANSERNHERQGVVVDAVARQVVAGSRSIVGIMMESNIEAGNQPISRNLAYGVSITDACVGWEDTEAILRKLAVSVHDPLIDRMVPAKAS
ncbi:MAG: 3-deoxy-7-phosphoheptulonate synthase [Gammaproteobacteria bacterium]|nr:3-deoxy-7-phosphoheptulonate synthase [Gammaproteobacteria bacterium]MYJ74116.1 3-deoxy-7-phosphoheptulonate synthase [Gammaproteobacteria bacterium]